MMKARNPQQYFLRGENIYQNNFLRSDSLIKKPYLSVYHDVNISRPSAVLLSFPSTHHRTGQYSFRLIISQS